MLSVLRLLMRVISHGLLRLLICGALYQNADRLADVAKAEVDRYPVQRFPFIGCYSDIEALIFCHCFCTPMLLLCVHVTP